MCVGHIVVSTTLISFRVQLVTLSDCTVALIGKIRRMVSHLGASVGEVKQDGDPNID